METAAGGDEGGCTGIEGRIRGPGPSGAPPGERGKDALTGRQAAGSGGPVAPTGGRGPGARFSAAVARPVRVSGREEEMEMAVTAERVMTRPLHLKVVEDRDPREIVAVILADGTIRDLRSPTSGDRDGWTTGSLSSPDWILWWDRR